MVESTAGTRLGGPRCEFSGRVLVLVPEPGTLTSDFGPGGRVITFPPAVKVDYLHNPPRPTVALLGLHGNDHKARLLIMNGSGASVDEVLEVLGAEQ